MITYLPTCHVTMESNHKYLVCREIGVDLEKFHDPEFIICQKWPASTSDEEIFNSIMEDLQNVAETRLSTGHWKCPKITPYEGITVLDTGVLFGRKIHDSAGPYCEDIDANVEALKAWLVRTREVGHQEFFRRLDDTWRLKKSEYGYSFISPGGVDKLMDLINQEPYYCSEE